MNPYFYLIAAFLLNAAGTVLVKVHSSAGFDLSGNLLQIFTKNVSFLLAIFLFGLNLVCYDLALKNLPLSIAYPVMTVASFMLVAGFSILYFKEHVTLLEAFGYALILCGITLVVSFAKN